MTILEILSPLRFLLLGVVILITIQLISLKIDKRRARNAKSKLLGCVKASAYPLKDPFFGVDYVYEAIKAAKSKTFLQQKRDHYERYGNTFTTQISTFPVINTIEPENIKQVLFSTYKDYEVGLPRRNAFSQILGNCIFTNDGSQWEHSRTMLRPLFSKQHTGDLSILESHFKDMIGAIPRDGSTIDLNELFLRYTADVATDFVFGESIDSLSHPESFQGNLMEAFQTVQQGAARNFRLGVFAKLIPYPAFDRALKLVHVYADDHINRAIDRHKLTNAAEKPQDDRKHTFLQGLLETTGNSQALRNELLAIFFAGRDTTSALLSNMFFVFSRIAHVWEEVCREVAELKGAKPTLDELKSMKYLGACLNESKMDVRTKNDLLLKANVHSSSAFPHHPKYFTYGTQRCGTTKRRRCRSDVSRLRRCW